MASPYEKNYELRYASLWLQQRVEVSVVRSAQYIGLEDPGVPDHANRVAWATWANSNSSVATIPFLWQVSLDPDVVAQGPNVTDLKIDGIVSAALPKVVADFVANSSV
jgi:hypothetical protein